MWIRLCSKLWLRRVKRIIQKVKLNLYSESEQDIDKTLLSLSLLVNKDYGLIKKIKRVRQYYDEPKFWYYSADVNDSYLKNDGRHFHSKSSGASLYSQKEALLKCLCELMERYCRSFLLLATIPRRPRLEWLSLGFFFKWRANLSISLLITATCTSADPVLTQ